MTTATMATTTGQTIQRIWSIPYTSGYNYIKKASLNVVLSTLLRDFVWFDVVCWLALQVSWIYSVQSRNTFHHRHNCAKTDTNNPTPISQNPQSHNSRYSHIKKYQANAANFDTT